ncbi:hypothetical protein QBC40DRAFT_343479 [Triangularia verruculosa]|uniref:Riboflavin kinase n=1 Tax=Triangularia verruculosa TaxID=2587418 RepID=A0AAN6X9C7_9PEZI|nr:hypothetical protein QBC40DRAFT_343479 [Triangularia verruculosa]
MAQPSTAVIGSTGLVGSYILSTLLSQNLPVTTISRRAPKATGPTLNPIIEPNTDLWATSLTSLSPPPKTVFSALGTTRAAAGGIANQWKIDHDLNVALARAAKESGVKTFVFVSSGGTRGLFSNWAPYSKMKIGVEDTIKELGFDNAVVLRPGFILGEREERRFSGEEQARGAARAVGRWFGLGLQDRFAQEGEVIARAAVKAVEMIDKGEAKERFWVLEQGDIVRLGREEWKKEEGGNPSTRPLLIGPPSGPSPPYPYRMSGPVIPGFGRGSKDLGIPTANLPVNTPLTPWISSISSGVYFGWASLLLPPTHPNYSPAPNAVWSVFPMVMSIGYNPFYKNDTRSAEVHVLHKFDQDFYGVETRLLIMGYIRDERDYKGVEELVEDIMFDCEVARRSLERPGWRVKELGGEFEGGWLVRTHDEEVDKEGQKASL